MREEIAEVVYATLASGLRLCERLAAGERPDLAEEQARLRALLDRAAEGARYALACWLDELFLASPWSASWNESKLEEGLYHSSDRAWKFWLQARLAQERGDRDALEVFYLCVLLGFRGDGPEGVPLPAWRNAVEGQLGLGQTKLWPGPQELKPEINAAPRRARERLRRVLALLLCLAVVGLFALAFVLLERLRR
jgi:type VI secretion system protein ImpK